MSKEVEWVDNDERLAALCEQWQQQAVIALDTEFIRTRTFFPKIGLLQIADAHGIYLIDPLEIKQSDALKSVLTAPQVIKVIHSCSEDLEVFDRFLSVLPSPLFDTQIAAAFAGFGASISYANLIKSIRGDEIPKQETRSDWLQRPLSQSQLDYAALDVEHLIEVYETLVETLTGKQRVAWVNRECQQLLEKAAQAQDNFAQYYLKVKSAWKLKPQQLAVLRDLCEWREQEARYIDTPRNHLVKDSTLLDMARVLPKESHHLYKLRDAHPRFVSRYGEQCIDIIRDAKRVTANYPKAMPAPLSAGQTSLFKELKAVVAAVAEELAIPPEFLARKKDLESLVYLAPKYIQGAQQQDSQPADIALPQNLQGWREEVIGKLLLESLVNMLASKPA